MAVERILLRRDTSANWTTANPVLYQGEEGLETDTGRRKIGDGSTAWNTLAYAPSGTGRQPLITTMTVPASATNTALDFSGHTLRTYATGDFTGVTSPNSGWALGVNVYTATGTAAGDGNGLQYLTGALLEADVRSTASIGTVIGSQSEAAFATATSDGGHATSMISHKVAAPKRKDGASTATATNVYGLWIDQVNASDLGATTAFSWYCPGGTGYHGGDLQLGGKLNFGSGITFGSDGTQLTTPNTVVSTGAGFYTSTGDLYGKSMKYATDSSHTISWCTGTPEGAVTANVGSIALRLDGGAATTLYVKESGTGATGWIAK